MFSWEYLYTVHCWKLNQSPQNVPSFKERIPRHKKSQRGKKKKKKTLNLEQKEVSIILQASPIWLTDTTRP
jgi:hypothetical protein